MEYNFDRFLLFDELTTWLRQKVEENPDILELESYGTSHEGRELWIVTITEKSTGLALHKPAHWVDANIHSVEVTAGVAACHLIQHLIDGFRTGDSVIRHALQTRTFYVVPRVNPDGVEASLGSTPVFQRSSVRSWPWEGHRWPGILESDIDGNGEIFMMRLRDPNGAWVSHPKDERVMIPVDHELSPVQHGNYDTPRYRLLKEGLIENYDGWTIPQPANPTGLDLNRNFPAGWSAEIKGSGDHALSEPEIYSLVRAIAARPNICGFNAYHTFGGVLLRSSRPDSELPAMDVWTYKMLGKKFTELTGNNVYSCYEDFMFDKSEDRMSGASDDFMYDHKGVFGWTTEFWDVIFHATGHHADTKIWYVGPTVEESLAIAAWADANAPGLYKSWEPFDHPQLGTVEIGGPNAFKLITNPPARFLRPEVEPHAKFAVYQALLSPKLEILHQKVTRLCGLQNGLPAWRVEIGIANTGYLPTNVTAMAAKIKVVLPIYVELSAASDSGVSVGALTMLDGYSPGRVQVNQLGGRQSMSINWDGCDGTPDRALCVWTIVAAENSFVQAKAVHQRAGTSTVTIELK